jgi:MerR family transcriptional regulator, light-induced transcriptional regulator
MTNSLQKAILSTSDVARLFNVTETTVKRWADDGTLKCQKTPGGHRKFEIRNVVEFAEENHFDPVGALEIPGDDDLGSKIQMAVLGREFPVLVAAYLRKALLMEESGLLPFLSYLYQHRVQIWEMHDLVIRPAMYEIGDRWSRGEIGVDQEHRASYETLEALAMLQLQIRIKPPSGRSVICATLGEELHEIGLRCAHYLFESEGWESRYLGSRIPADAINAAIVKWKPGIICLSTTYGDSGELQAELRRIVDAARSVDAVVLAGGGLAGSLKPEEGVIETAHNSSKGLLCYIQNFDRTGTHGNGGDTPT